MKKLRVQASLFNYVEEKKFSIFKAPLLIYETISAFIPHPSSFILYLTDRFHLEAAPKADNANTPNTVLGSGTASGGVVAPT